MKSFMKSTKTFFHYVAVLAVFFSLVLVSCHPTDESDFCSYHKINYVLNGGVNNPLNRTEGIASDGAIILYPPSRPGYVFAGWYLDSKFKGNEITYIDCESFTETDIFLYAKWQDLSEIRRINYVLNGGVNNPLNKSTVSKDDPSFQLYSPTRSGYNFAGWYEDPNFNTKVSYIYPRSLTGDYTVYARWR